MEKIIIIGAGGHAKTIVDTIEKQNLYEIVGFVTREEDEVTYRNYASVGVDDNLERLYAEGIRTAVIAVGYLDNSAVRDSLYDRLKQIGYELPVIIDDSAVVAKDTVIGEGTYVGRNVVINADASVGKMCIINTGAIVEHDCTVADFSHIAVGATLCGGVRIGAHTMIGANATVLQKCSVGKDCIVGAGAVVVNDVPDDCTVVGVPAREIRHG